MPEQLLQQEFVTAGFTQLRLYPHTLLLGKLDELEQADLPFGLVCDPIEQQGGERDLKQQDPQESGMHQGFHPMGVAIGPSFEMTMAFEGFEEDFDAPSDSVHFRDGSGAPNGGGDVGDEDLPTQQGELLLGGSAPFVPVGPQFAAAFRRHRLGDGAGDQAQGQALFLSDFHGLVEGAGGLEQGQQTLSQISA